MIPEPPFIEVPWRYEAEDGFHACFYTGNKPEACVLHISTGWRSTAEDWARRGHYGASWGHYVCLDGAILRHLQKDQGGYHAGVSKFRRDWDGVLRPRPYPIWPLFKGWQEDGHPNVNQYTDSIECEGKGPLTEPQKASLKWLCQWLAQDRGYPYDRDHFPAHADIDLVDRPNDFGTPAEREEVYAFLFDEEDELTPEERTLIAVAWGDYDRMKASYVALVNAKLIPDEAIGATDDLNSAVVKRGRIMELVATNPQKAYEVIK